MPPVVKVFFECCEQIESRNQQIVTLEFITKRTAKRKKYPVHPLVFIHSVLVNHTQFAVKNADTLLHWDRLSRRRIVPIDKERCLSARDFQTCRTHIVLPGLALWEFDPLSTFTGIISEYVLHTEPIGIQGIDHHGAHPHRREHLGMRSGSLGLLILMFLRPTADKTSMHTSNQFRSDFAVMRICRAAFRVHVGAPQDVPLRCLVLQQQSKHTSLVGAHQIRLNVARHVHPLLTGTGFASTHQITPGGVLGKIRWSLK